MQVIYESHWQARKVRIFAWATALWCIGWLYWAYDLSQTYGLSPGDGGVLRPAVDRYTFAAIMALIGIAPLAGMAVYVRLYVTRLARDGDRIAMTVVGLLRPRTFDVPLTAVADKIGRHGQTPIYGWIKVYAPWITLRVSGRPYIIDQQAETLDEAALRRLVKDGNRAAQAAKA